MSIADPNKTILTGENPFIRLSLKDGDSSSTDASYWRIIFSPAGPGHVLYLKSELTEGHWRIYSDNIAMARWLQTTVQGMLNAELSDTTIPCAEATFSKAGDPRYFWTEHIRSHGEDISLTWFDIGEPLLIHSQPNQIPNRRYGVCTVLIPALGTRLVRNGIEAKGQSWSREREGRPFATSALAFSESWSDASEAERQGAEVCNAENDPGCVKTLRRAKKRTTTVPACGLTPVGRDIVSESAHCA